MAIQLQPLPYDLDALEPFISSVTLDSHYGHHHKGYVDQLNKLIRHSPCDSESLVGIILKSALNRETPRDQKIYHCASQAWNPVIRDFLHSERRYSIGVWKNTASGV